MLIKTNETDTSITEQQQQLAQLIEHFTPSDGIHPTAIPSLALIRASEISQPIYSVYQPSLCIVA